MAERTWLTGPKTNWLKWQEARDRKLANPKRNPGAKRMRKAAAMRQKEPI